MPTVAACQFDVDDLDPESNVIAITERIANLPDTVELAVFPEYAVTGYVPDERARASAIDQSDTQLETIAAQARAYDLDVVIGFLEESGDTLHNSLAYLEAGGTRTIYRKRHLWATEAEFLTPGDSRAIVETPLGTTGLVTCYDLNFVAESAAFTDPPVDALLVAGAWPAAHAANWDLLLRARALDGVRWVVGAGRTGVRDVPGTERTPYAGRSAIVRPDGSLMGRLNRENRDLIRAIDRTELARHRAFIGSIE